MKRLLLFILLPLQPAAQTFSANEAARWQTRAQQVTIIRDHFGIPHIYGKTDADAVFGLMYAQCEDDFKRVEMNYIEKLGRMSEIKGEAELQNDLYVKLIIDSAEAVKDYNQSPAWLKKLLNAWADGINFYLFKHTSTKPLLLKRFKPWYPLLWTDGSIGAISTGDITAADVKDFYFNHTTSVAKNTVVPEEPVTGSNGFAIAPARTVSGNAILYINPHVSFYFRPEVHMVSEEGLNVYGAVTWGQFFVYQGFNRHCGWMHTSSKVDVADMYIEKISSRENGLVYEYDQSLKPLISKPISIRYKKDSTVLSKTIVTYYTGHGPVMAQRNGQWISVKSFNRSMTGLMQSWQRTKATGFDNYKKIMGLRANTSNNTVFADDKGNIAYWHGDFVPVRNKSYNWSQPLDGTSSNTEWKGLHSLDDIVHVYNPASGWIQNCNSTPFTVSGSSSPKKEKYPAYMAPDGENYRGINAAALLANAKSMTIDKTIALGYNRNLAAFKELIPALCHAYQTNFNQQYETLQEPVDLLKTWDLHCGENSIATTLAVLWGEKLIPLMPKGYDENGYHYTDQVSRTKEFLQNVSAATLLDTMLKVKEELTTKFGTWKLEWGTINRYQRISADIDQQYSDDQPGTAVGFASSAWGMLPSYASRSFNGTKKRYGEHGNSFICAVEFGKHIKAKSLLAGGESGDPKSPHFNDQLEMYARGQFKEVLFYKEDVMKHAEKTYHPGD